MFFYAAKVMWFGLAPTNCALIIESFGAALLLTRWRTLGRTLVALGLVALVAMGATPVPRLALQFLESRFPSPSLSEPVDGIIVLGGVSRVRGQIALNESGSRILAGVGVALLQPWAKIILSGGDAHLIPRNVETEAEDAAFIFRMAGLHGSRIILETRSRNTHENAVYTRELSTVTPGQRWLLITSAFHMPRAVGCFRAAGMNVIAYPVDFRTTGGLADFEPPSSFANSLRLADVLANEAVGLIMYRILGYSSELIPSANADQPANNQS